MGLTYTTSDECAYSSGMPSQDANSFPTTTMIDSYRTTAYNRIIQIIGVVADVNGTAHDVELDLVTLKINNVQNKTNFVIQLSEEHKNMLWSTWPDARPLGSFEVSQDL
jgi:hypothetical protein